MANKAVGEINMTISGREFLLRPSFNGLTEIESRADCGLLEIARDIFNGKVKLKHIAAIIYGGIVGALPKGQKPEITFDELGELLVKDNYPQYVTPAVLFFGDAIKGNPEEKKSE